MRAYDWSVRREVAWIGARIEHELGLGSGSLDEAIRVALVAADKKHGAATSLVPFPIAAEDKGCKLQVIRGMKDEQLVLIVGDGFTSTTNFVAGS